VSEAERVAHRLNAEADRHKQLALEASNVDDRMFHRLMFHLCREAASKTLLAEEDFQLKRFAPSSDMITTEIGRSGAGRSRPGVGCCGSGGCRTRPRR